MSNFFTLNGAAMTCDRTDWETPQALYDELNEQFKFDCDVAANDLNHKHDCYYTPEYDALAHEWHGVVFCNPPYGRDIGRWVKKAHDESKAGRATVVMLIPARTDTAYWHDYIFGFAQIKFLRGRLKFEQGGVPGDAAPFPSAIVVFEKGFCKPIYPERLGA